MPGIALSVPHRIVKEQYLKAHLGVRGEAMKKDNFGKNIPTIEKIIGYTFKDKSLLKQAFTRTSFSNEAGFVDGEKYQSNEVLEFFGDGVLSLAIISFLLSTCTERYEHGIRTKLTEGDFSNIKSKLSDKTNLSKSTARLGLEKFLLLGEGDAKLGIASEPSVMEDLFESIVGAVYIDADKNIEAVSRVVGHMLDMSVYTSERAPMQSAKNALQEWCADKKRRLPAPVYKTLSEDGPDHRKIYERGVYIGDRLVARAKGKNQKMADSAAAQMALEALTRQAGGAMQKSSETEAPASQNTPTRAKKKAKNRKSDSQAKEAITLAEPGVEEKPKASKMAQTKAPQNAKKIVGATLGRKTVKGASAASGASQKLKKHAASRGIASPAFRDLGVTRTHSGNIEYRIECEFDGRRVAGVAASRTEAREAAAEKMAEDIGIK